MTAKASKRGTPFPARKDFDIEQAKQMAQSGVSRSAVAAHFGVSFWTLARRNIRFVRKVQASQALFVSITQARDLEQTGKSQRQIAREMHISRQFLREQGIGIRKPEQKAMDLQRLQAAAEMHLYGATERFIAAKTGMSHMTWRNHKRKWLSYLST